MKKFLRGLTSGVLTMIVLWSMSGCKKIEPDSPPVSIQSVRALSLTTYEVVVRFEYVDLYKIRSGKVIFDDITVLTDSDIEKEFTVGNGRNQTDTLIVETGRLTHDYYVTVSAETNKGLCTCEPFLMRSKKYNFTVDIVPSNFFSDLRHKIADFVNRGTGFSIKVACLNTYKPSVVEVKLNRTIPLGHTLEFVNYSSVYNPDYQISTFETFGSASISLDIEPDVYDVYVYIDGIEFKSPNKIRVLAGSWTVIEPDFQGGNKGNYAWFVKGDNLYLTGGEYYLTEITESPVWKYNIPLNQWERKSNFPHPGDVTKNKIMPLNLEYNGAGYVVLKNDTSIEVWKYNIESDHWSFITTYPGLGKEYLTGFISNGKLYLGGGVWSVCFQDFWAYDLQTSAWEKKSDMPSSSWGSMSSVLSSGTAYVFPYSGELWQYDPGRNKWTLKAKFPGHQRVISNITVMDDKLYITGGLYQNTEFFPLGDCWRYSEADNTWEMVAFLPMSYGNGVSFTYQGSLYSGLGWVINDGYTTYDKLVFYKLDI
jgi:hypothetical protein